ncbi:MAG: hypothetical protein JRG91_17895 [Deltaproteobacteria bacterium]|nr:hypothetical protein [Deltaproteobacteria bacterium]
MMLVAAAVLCSCKGRGPNYVRVDLPMAGDEYGPDGVIEKGGAAIAFHDLEVHVVEAASAGIVHHVFREDGRDEGSGIVLELDIDLWDLDAERIASKLGDGALEWEEQERLEKCIEAVPKKIKSRIAILPGGLSPRPGGGWALAFSAVNRLTCGGGKKVVACLDHVVLFDEDWSLTDEPELVRYGGEPRVHAIVFSGDEPLLAWATKTAAGISSPASTTPIPVKDGALEYEPLFVQAGDRLAVITRPPGRIRARLLDLPDGSSAVDVLINPGKNPLSVAAAWTGDRLGVFFGLDRAEGVSSLLQHILVEVHPGGTASTPVKIYTQFSMAEDTCFTCHFTAVFADDTYALAWIADDGYSQDLYLQEVPLGGLAGEKKAWRRDFPEGYRALKGVTLFATPPQYVVHYLAATAYTTHAHKIFLTALPTQR